jgi:hypothetical protein
VIALKRLDVVIHDLGEELTVLIVSVVRGSCRPEGGTRCKLGGTHVADNQRTQLSRQVVRVAGCIDLFTYADSGGRHRELQGPSVGSVPLPVTKRDALAG